MKIIFNCSIINDGIVGTKWNDCGNCDISYNFNIKVLKIPSSGEALSIIAIWFL